MPPIIHVENISKRYIISHNQQRGGQTFRELLMSPFQKKITDGKKEEFWALKDIDFDVEAGDRIGIIGRNGAGKSTLLKVLSKITTPTTGRITINGRIASLLEVGTGFHPELTGRENIFLNGAILGMRHAEIAKKFDEIVDFSGVEKFLDTPVKRYSSGMYVRLAFAVAAHLEPEILVVDEVLAVGDAEFQKKCLGKMNEISHDGGRTILFVSHNMGAVQDLCNKGIFLQNGKITKKGSVADVIQNYLLNPAFTQNSAREFPEQTEKEMFIKKIEICDQDGNPKNSFDILEDIIIKITSKVNTDSKNTNLSLSISKDGCLLFSTWDTDLLPSFQNRETGEYIHTLKIPPILTNGKYSITVDCGHPNVCCLERHQDVLSFSINHLTIDGSAKGSTRGGLIRPNLHWTGMKIK